MGMIGFIFTTMGATFTPEMPIYGLILMGIGLWTNIGLKEGLKDLKLTIYRIYKSFLYLASLAFIFTR